MYSNLRTPGSGRSGSQPVFVNEVVGINATNPFLTPQIRNQLTFVNGVAQVRVNRSLSELGIIKADTERDTYQGQAGLRSKVTPAIKAEDRQSVGQGKSVSVRVDLGGRRCN